jgi:hypothetical protein
MAPLHVDTPPSWHAVVGALERAGISGDSDRERTGRSDMPGEPRMPADGDRHGVVFGDHRDLQNECAVAEIGRELHPSAEGSRGRQPADQRAGAVVEVGEPGQPVQAVALPCRWEMVGLASEVEPTATEQAASGHHEECAPR